MDYRWVIVKIIVVGGGRLQVPIAYNLCAGEGTVPVGPARAHQGTGSHPAGDVMAWNHRASSVRSAQYNTR